jgi:hypothetical protein
MPIAVETDWFRLWKRMRICELGGLAWYQKSGTVAVCFQTVSDHIGREANQVALAQLQPASNKRQCMVMRFNVPPEIQAMVQKT